MELHAVVFDMDGVLVDSEPLYEASFRSFMGSIGRPELGDWFPNTLGRREADFLPELVDLLDLPAGELRSGMDAALAPLMEDELVPMPHVHEALGRIAGGGRDLALASSSSRRFVERVLATLDVGGLFKVVASGDDVRRGKPDPEIYELAVARLGGVSHRAIAIEDSPTGVASAAAAGLRTIAVPAQHASAEQLADADAIAADLREAADLILRWDRDGCAGLYSRSARL